MAEGGGARAVNEPQGWVLYDARCGICSRWVPFWRSTLQGIGLAIAPLQSSWVRARAGLSDETLAADLRLLLDDGTQIVGANAYRYVMRRIWWARPFYVLSVLPGLRRLFDLSYRRFADNRYRLSHTCGLSHVPDERRE